MYEITEIELYIKEWIKKVSNYREELGGFSICPYALNAKFKIILNLNNNIDNITPIDNYDIVFFVLSNDIEFNQILDIVEECNKIHPEWEFFEDCASYNTFIGKTQTNNGKYNLILAQPREKLKKLRLSLAKTNYYKYWDEEYLKEILKEDYDIIKSIITG